MVINRKRLFLWLFLLASIIIIPSTKAQAFEKELENSTGFGTVSLTLRSNASSSSQNLGEIPEGTPFRILSESGNWWKIDYNGKIGYVYHPYCMINLPDVEPSIIYNISCAYSCGTKASGKSLPGVTGEKLYAAGKVTNNKIGRQEFIVPVLYSAAKKISLAQEYASNDGYTLKIYDAYRPVSVSKKLCDGLRVLYNRDATVKKYIDYSYNAQGKRISYWGQGWFVAQSLSTHNVGAAIDVTLAKKSNGQELQMPTVMDECSTWAIKYYSPSVAKNSNNYNYTMNSNAIKLDRYCTAAGMGTLSSEWWHFQDNEGFSRIKKLRNGTGCNFQVYSIVSKTNKDSIKWATSNRIMLGDGNGNLNLSGKLCRADAFVLLYRMAGEPSVSTFNTGFVDVSSNAYYAKAVIWGKKQGIINGIEKNGKIYFDPWGSCSRGAFVTFLHRYAGSPYASISKNYSSVKDFNQPTNWALNNGIISKDMAKNIDKQITREETIDILYAYKNKFGVKQQSTTTTYLNQTQYQKQVSILFNANGGTPNVRRLVDCRKSNQTITNSYKRWIYI